MADKEKNDVILLPEGRVINHSMFVKDEFKGKIAYRLELAFDEKYEEDLLDLLFDFAEDTWGGDAEKDYKNEDLILPLKDGDKMARKRERNDKDGSAYEGKFILRSKTNFNKDGLDAPGGIQVYNEAVEMIEGANQGEIYRGCYGVAAVEFASYEDDDGVNAVNVYLKAFQKTRDGDPIAGSADHSSLFEATKKAGKSKKRRRRKSNDDD